MCNTQNAACCPVSPRGATHSTLAAEVVVVVGGCWAATARETHTTAKPDRGKARCAHAFVIATRRLLRLLLVVALPL